MNLPYSCSCSLRVIGVSSKYFLDVNKCFTTELNKVRQNLAFLMMTSKFKERISKSSFKTGGLGTYRRSSAVITKFLFHASSACVSFKCMTCYTCVMLSEQKLPLFFFFLPWEDTTQRESLFPCIAAGIWEQSMPLPLAIMMESLPSCPAQQCLLAKNFSFTA